MSLTLSVDASASKTYSRIAMNTYKLSAHISHQQFHSFSDSLAPLPIIIFIRFILYVYYDVSVSLDCFSDHQRGRLYQGLHSGSSMVAMGKAGLLGHSLGGYGLPSPGASGTFALYNLFYCK